MNAVGLRLLVLTAFAKVLQETDNRCLVAGRQKGKEDR